jgi:hypothetical protein
MGRQRRVGDDNEEIDIAILMGLPIGVGPIEIDRLRLQGLDDASGGFLQEFLINGPHSDYILPDLSTPTKRWPRRSGLIVRWFSHS